MERRVEPESWMAIQRVPVMRLLSTQTEAPSSLQRQQMHILRMPAKLDLGLLPSSQSDRQNTKHVALRGNGKDGRDQRRKE